MKFQEMPSVAALIDALNARFPGILMRLLDDQGNVRRYVNIFVDGEDIRGRDGLRTPLSGAKEVVILPSVAGG
jgi:molybdopterin synthase sulfur carrier subunit